MSSPRLSIVIPLYNAQSDLPRFFRSLERQHIPKNWVEVLVIDGGSTDKTAEIAKTNGAIVIPNPYKLTEPGVAIGFAKATAELVMVMAADNIFRDSEAIINIIDIFRDKRITAAFPKHDTGSGDTIYSRYINTFTDPFTHFVYGDAANARTFHNIYKTLVHTPVYDVYDYRSNPQRPIIALAQGLTVRKSRLHTRREFSDDILAIYALIDEGKWIAYAHGVTLLHYTIRDTNQFITKQRRAVENALLRGDSGITKRDKLLTRKQWILSYLYVPYALTIVLPLVRSIINAVITKQTIWLVHWYMVFLSAIVIITTAIPLGMRRVMHHE